MVAISSAKLFMNHLESLMTAGGGHDGRRACCESQKKSIQTMTPSRSPKKGISSRIDGSAKGDDRCDDARVQQRQSDMHFTHKHETCWLFIEIQQDCIDNVGECVAPSVADETS